jgi:uncharacterized protein with HEPN domain
MKDDKLYLLNILESIEKIEEYTKEGREAFEKSTMVQDAVIRNFEIMGEAAKKISTGTRESYDQIPWKRVAGFRDVLIHDYLGVDTDQVWNIVEKHVPFLKSRIKTILAELLK